MKGYQVSYLGMFDDGRTVLPIRRVQIPIIQRDYAQGRIDPQVTDIRMDFLDVLLGALDGEGPVELDFVYGRVHGDVLRPLDGQQRLTTLFLLHWYTASLAGALDRTSAWTQFSYDTRPGARLFCERLVEHPLPAAVPLPSTWLRDQAWYLHQWRADPTVGAMEVMLDAIHTSWRERHPALEPGTAWRRLSDENDPAITFSLLPLDDMDSDESLYVTMNSRGKPLTAFEHLKARLEQEISGSPRSAEIAEKFDGAWADLFWPIHGGDDNVDDELMRYLDYVTEVCEWRDATDGPLLPGRAGEHRLVGRMRETFGALNPRSEEHLAFLVEAFDAWRTHPHALATTESLLSTTAPGEDGYDPTRTRLFGVATVDLLQRCSHEYDSRRQRREFTLQDTVLLHAVLTHLREDTPDPASRIRTIRNLAAGSEDEIRRDTMPLLLRSTEQFMRDGALDAIAGFSVNQVADEIAKAAFLVSHPEVRPMLNRLEDADLLRGNLSAFDLDPDTLPRRAAAFEVAFGDPAQWLSLTGALLATGEYARRPRGGRAWLFGTVVPRQEGRWRYLLTQGTRDALTGTREVLGRFLDGVAEAVIDGGRSFADHCADVMADFLAECRAARHLDWRYYLVAYPSMRPGDTGMYFSTTGELGYMLCMMRRTQVNSNYRDPILLEVWHRSEVGDAVDDPWFYGWETNPRWMTLVASGTGVQSVAEGFLLRPPSGASRIERFQAVAAGLPVEASDDEVLLRVPQDGDVDVEDRVEIGAALVRRLVEAGL